MDYFQGVVTEYLVADRATYVNSELLIQLDADEPKKGRHWYCDAAAVDFRKKTLFLCEVTYSKSMSAISKRFLAWNQHWKELRIAIDRDCGISNSWEIKPWAFIPKQFSQTLKDQISALEANQADNNLMPYPRITHLEEVVPWNYVTWDRKVTALENDG